VTHSREVRGLSLGGRGCASSVTNPAGKLTCIPQSMLLDPAELSHKLDQFLGGRSGPDVDQELVVHPQAAAVVLVEVEGVGLGVLGLEVAGQWSCVS